MQYESVEEVRVEIARLDELIEKARSTQQAGAETLFLDRRARLVKELEDLIGELMRLDRHLCVFAEASKKK